MFNNRLFYSTPGLKLDGRFDADDGRKRATLGEANVVSSETENGTHRPVLDLDFPATLLPSSTPGHYHLYLEREMSWGVYEQLLEALAKAGIIQKGYLKASKHRKATFLRLPWIKKEGGSASS